MARTKPPVLMQIIPSLGGGGAEQGCIDMAASAVKRGWRSIVVSHGGFRVPELLRAKATHIDLSVDSKNPFVMAANIGRIRALIRKHGVDIVHVRSRAPAWSAREAVKGTDAHFITTAHNAYRHTNSAKKFYNSIMGAGERVIAISSYVADHMRAEFGVGDDRLRTVHRGIAFEKFHPSAVTPDRMIALAKAWRVPDGALVALLPGRITRWKGQDVFLKALARLKRNDVFGIMVGVSGGHDAYRHELDEFITAHLPGRARVIDHCADMPAAYMLANVVVSASTQAEGFGRVAVEGQAMGRPTIATDLGGSKETILRGETGWLIPAGDDTAMARALDEALTIDNEQRMRMGMRAMDHVHQHFSTQTMVDRTFAVYAECLVG